MKDLSKVWCTTPWYEIYLKPEGGVRSCCDNTKDSEFQFSEVNNDIKSAFNHEHYKTIRREMLEGKEPEACKRCYDKEKETGKSLRTDRISKRYLSILGMGKTLSHTEPMDKLINELEVEWDPRNIKKLKIDFSNGCNLKCPMCSPHRSTSWFKDKIAMDKEFVYDNYKWWKQIKDPLDAEKQKFFSSSIPLDFVDKNWAYLKTLKQIEVSGGEPFYHPQFLYLVDRLVEEKWHGRLNIISNITLLDDTLIEKLRQLRVSMDISIDGMGDLYEYVRPAVTIGKYKWKDIDETIQKLKALKTYPRQTGIYYTFAYVPQLLNFYNIVDWLNYASNAMSIYDTSRNKILSHCLHNPYFLKICHHPDKTEKLKLQNKLKDFVHIRGVEAIIKALDAETKPEDWKAFCKYINFLDKQRETSIINYAPEFAKYWIGS